MSSCMRLTIAVALHVACTCALAETKDLLWRDGDAGRLSEIIDSGRYGQVTSLWIEQDGQVVYERYFHASNANTVHNMRSAGKTITGLLVGAAIDDGFIENVDTMAAAFFGDIRPFENNDPRKESITIKDLLTMSSPLECDDWNSFSRGNEERMYLVEDWSSFFWDLPIKNRPSWEIPENDGGFDRVFTYCTAGAQLLGEIVERAVGESAPEYAAKRLFAAMRIVDPKWNFASSGKAHLGGGLELTTADWATTGRLYLNHGRMYDARIISESWINASLANYVRIDENTNYGYLWWRPRYELGDKSYVGNMMSGSGGNRVYVLPEFRIVVVITKSDFRDRDAHAKTDQLFADEVIARLEK